jgi:hypothetical protein
MNYGRGVERGAGPIEVVQRWTAITARPKITLMPVGTDQPRIDPEPVFGNNAPRWTERRVA